MGIWPVDPELMQRLAEAGPGAFYFLQTRQWRWRAEWWRKSGRRRRSFHRRHFCDRTCENRGVRLTGVHDRRDIPACFVSVARASSFAASVQSRFRDAD